MNNSEQQHEIECPKCGCVTRNIEVCEFCGAVMAKVLGRALDQQPGADYDTPRPPVLEYEEIPDDSPTSAPPDQSRSLIPILLVVVVACALGGFFAWKSGNLPLFEQAAPVAAAPTPEPKPRRQSILLQGLADAPTPRPKPTVTPQPTASPASPIANGPSIMGALADAFLTAPAKTPAPRVDAPPTPAIMAAPVQTPPAELPGGTPTAAAATPLSTSPTLTPAVQAAAAKPATKGSHEFSTRKNPIFLDIGEDQFKTGGYGRQSASIDATPRPSVDDEPAENLSQAPADEAPVPQTPPSPAASLVASVSESSFRDEVLRHRKGPVLVDFFATWCGPCKKLAPTVEGAAQHYQGKMKVVKLDIDQNRNLTDKYDVTGFPTLLVFKNGREVERMVGVVSAAELKTAIERHL